MAFKASNVIPSKEYDRSKQLAIQLKRMAQSRSSMLASGADASQILAMVDNFKAMRTELASIRQTPGIGDYARDQEDDVNYDVAAEYNAMIAAVDAVISDIASTMPQDGNGYLLTHTIDGSGTLSPRVFSAGSLANLKTLVDAVDAAII